MVSESPNGFYLLSSASLKLESECDGVDRQGWRKPLTTIILFVVETFTELLTPKIAFGRK